MRGSEQAAPGRNDPCPCGSGRKYKACCADKDRAAAAEAELGRTQLRRAVALERQGRTDEALAGYRLAATFAATAPEANSRLGHVLLSLGRAKEAVDAFKAAEAAGPALPERRMDLARALIIERQDEAAEAVAREALALDPASADGWWVLGRILAEAGRFDEARAALERSVALEPGRGAVYYDLVRSYRLSEVDRPLVERMLALARAGGDTDQRVRLHLAIGKAFDDLGDPEAAMRHFAKADLARQAMVRFDRAGFARRVDGLIERFTPAFLATHAADGDDSPLPVMVVGMPRSGTTLVEQMLSSHPAVAGAGELQFWPGRAVLFEQLGPAGGVAEFQRQAARDGLETLGGLAEGAVRVIDKTPLNFLWAGLIHLVFPKATIIHCRRDPLDTCLSIQSTYFAPRTDFATHGEDLVFYWRQYERLMAHWRASLPAERFVEVDYEALVAEPEPQARRLVAALGLDWDPACLHPERNGRVVRTASKWQARQPISTGSVGRWRLYEPYLGSLRDLIKSK